MPIKLIASDLDGTLVADLRTISPRTQAAVKAAMDQGVQFTIATGREYPMTERFVKMLGLTAPTICYQGALVYNPVTQSTVASDSMPVPLAHQLITLARRDNLSLHLYLENTAYTENVTPQSKTIFAGIGTPVVPVDDLKQAVTRPPVKGIIVHPAAETDAVMDSLRKELNGQISVFRSLDTLIELTSPQVSKGNALAKLAAHFGIDQSEVMAMGDQDNDIDMLKWAGVGVAMGNASAGAKAAADVIAPSITEDGAAWAIEHFVLGEK
jgi:Cof subfamily protein (haloacid dehalogenase superfamily)